MATVPDKVGSIWRSTSAVMYANQQVEVITLSWEVNIAGGGDSRFALAQNIDNKIITNILPMLPTSCFFLGTKITYLSTPVRYAGVHEVLNTPGGGGTVSLPTNSRIVISLLTDLVGRKYRGRCYGFTADSTQVTPSGHPTPALIAAWTAFFTGYIPTVTIAGTEWRLDVYHRPPKGSAPDAGIGTALSGFRVNAKFGTQRRSSDYGRVNINPI